MPADAVHPAGFEVVADSAVLSCDEVFGSVISLCSCIDVVTVYVDA